MLGLMGDEYRQRGEGGRVIYLSLIETRGSTMDLLSGVLLCHSPSRISLGSNKIMPISIIRQHSRCA